MSDATMNGEKKVKNNGLELFFSVAKHYRHKNAESDIFEILQKKYFLASFIQLVLKVTKKRRIILNID